MCRKTACTMIFFPSYDRTMSSISRNFSQRLTNKLIATGMPFLFTEADMANAAIAGNAQVLGSVVLVPTLSDLSGYMTSLPGICIASREILLDLGVTLHVGIQGVESDLLVFRLVQRTNVSVADRGTGAVGYVVVDNNIKGDDELPMNDFYVGVARIS